MILSKRMWLTGAAMALESMRRGFVGGSLLSLFVIKEFGLEGAAVPTMNFLRGYLAIEEELLTKIPITLPAIVQPFIDYHEASKLALQIFDILSESQRPRACHYYWTKGES